MQLSLEARQRIHERYERQSVSQRQLAEDFQVSLSTVKRILKRSKDDLGRRAGSGNPGKIHERERQCIAEYAQRYPDAFLREYADEIERKCGVRVTEQAVSVHLRKLKWTLKQTHLSGILSERWQQQWQHFIAELTQLLQEPEVEFLWGDETAVYDDWIRHRARAPVGLPVENFNHPRTQPRKQTLIAAMSAKKVFAPWCFEGSLESEKMLQWLQQLRPQLHENHVLILDNARPHHARKVRVPSGSSDPDSIFATIFSTHELIENCGRRSSNSGDNDVRAFLLPSYAPSRLTADCGEERKAIVASCGYSSF